MQLGYYALEFEKDTMGKRLDGRLCDSSVCISDLLVVLEGRTSTWEDSCSVDLVLVIPQLELEMGMWFVQLVISLGVVFVWLLVYRDWVMLQEVY